MKNSFRKMIALGALAAPMVCSEILARAQDSSTQTLGDVARKARKEHSSAAPAKHVANGEDDGPDGSGVWRVRPCASTILCYELSIVLPKSLKWTRQTSEPRPVLIPLPGRPSGQENDSDHAIRVYAAQTLAPNQSADVAKRTFLQSWFARPEYFGQAARLALDEHVYLDNSLATITHFTVTAAQVKYRGLSVVSGWTYGNFGFACVFREDDSAAANSICDAIIRSAKYQVLQPAKPMVYADPGNDDPPADDPPTDDPRMNEDPD